MRRLLIIILLVSLASLIGCASVPFAKHERVLMKGPEPSQVVSAYAEALPNRLYLLNSLVFRYNFMYKIGTVVIIGK